MVRFFIALLLINISIGYNLNAQKIIFASNLTYYQQWVDKYRNEENDYPSFGYSPLPYKDIHVDTVIIKHFDFISNFVIKLYKEYNIHCSHKLMKTAVWVNKNGKIDRLVFWIENQTENHHNKILQTMKKVLDGYVLKQKPRRNYYLCFSASLPKILNNEKNKVIN